MNCSVLLDSKSQPELTCNCDQQVTVSADNQTAIAVSGPLNFAIDAGTKRVVMKPKTQETISWDIKIGGKWTVSGLSAGDRSNPPVVKFLKKGKLINTTTAGYT